MTSELGRSGRTPARARQDTMTYDISAIRSHFPSLRSGIAYFDGPGGTQVPDVVGNAISKAITMPISNRGLITESEKNADEIVLQFRRAVADLIDADEKGVVCGPSWTQLTWNFSRLISKQWKAGDEVIVTRLDHDSNVRPWIQVQLTHDIPDAMITSKASAT